MPFLIYPFLDSKKQFQLLFQIYLPVYRFYCRLKRFFDTKFFISRDVASAAAPCRLATSLLPINLHFNDNGYVNLIWVACVVKIIVLFFVIIVAVVLRCRNKKSRSALPLVTTFIIAEACGGSHECNLW